MKQIRKDEIYNQLSEFLKGKGVELKEGPYTRGIHAGCSMLADAINLSQAGIVRAKTGIERGVDQMRQVIHEKTAPKSAHQPKGSKPSPNAKSKSKKAANQKSRSGSKKSGPSRK
jgi:hypothetical protein